LDLKKGLNEISISDITMHLEPDSVILRDPTGRHNLQILEQSYRADPVSEGLLLSLYEGKEIDFLIREDKERIVRGRIIRSGYVPHRAGMLRYGEDYSMRQMAYSTGDMGQPIIEIDGRLRFGLPGLPLFPALSDDAILRPTLQWVLASDRAGALTAELSYVTAGISWDADYNLISPTEGDTVDVIGWVTMDNQTGKSFHDARIKLMAGDVSKIQQPRATGALMRSMDAAESTAAVTEKAFEEYHLYTLPRPVTLLDRQTKQVEFLRAEGVQAQRIYVYDGAKLGTDRYGRYLSDQVIQDRGYGTECNPKVWVMKEFKNSKENHLGIPLPKGRMRFYRKDEDGQLEFTGENVIDHTPKDETIRVAIGDAFDLVGERIQTDFVIDVGRRMMDEALQIKLRNRKEKDTVEIRVVEHLYRWYTWQILQSSVSFKTAPDQVSTTVQAALPFEKVDGRTIEFRVQVPAGQERIINYKVHYTW